MSEIVDKIAVCIERGKINKNAPYPPDMKGQDGSDELARTALEQGVKPAELLNGCMVGMKRIGDRFGQGKAFVPELLMAAKSMTAVMQHLKPFFQSGEVQRKGAFVLGTVAGDLHDIGKNLVGMSLEGAGWEVIDLGVDVKPEKFVEAAKERPDCFLGLSALLTTTMVNMEAVVKLIRENGLQNKILIGGAPVTDDFRQKIGADFYAKDPQSAVDYLDAMVN